ncbi:thiol:disulfide interchange protein DsbA/DsbL [Thiospirillum jenense]|uniref:Thiol:disulfide interchange protein n=1 Tax=Thiospirillum jenense TaxID=1653858 RepID=A0A839HEB3_9GAMM|nr:thiol:disulfide interchange protein DsbA/DsbL [Thiospirillum jenense]MBB1127275.1 thiol:disulfide interchange protein DsbA/DsbL [Thiospirillum jenense]
MPITRRTFHRMFVTAIGTLLSPFAIRAIAIENETTPTSLVEGRDWERVKSLQSIADTNKIEVLEFFSYGCPHCGHFNPLLIEWAEKLPTDVTFQRIPVTFGRAAWEMLARLYFALNYTGDLKRLDQMVFDAVTRDHTNLYSEKSILKWLEAQKVDTTAFASVLNSFEVAAQLARAAELNDRYQIDAVPRLIIDGRYVVIGREAKSLNDLLKIADDLLALVRTQRTAQAVAS